MKAGDRYGQYVVVRQIGHGSMGDVYLARDLTTNRELALKLVYKGTDPDDLEILEAERVGAEVQRRLQGVDRRVVPVYAFGETSGYFYIDMEFIEGEDLSVLISRAPIHPGFAVYVARELCDMLENLRCFTTEVGERRFYGVIHGDLKPRNIRIDKLNRVRVVDFGIAKALTHTHKYTLNLFASTAYCSPERIETQNMDTMSDLWSVGVLLYQMVAQRLPFEGQTKEILERRIRTAQAPDPLPSCPAPLRDIIFKMLARDPSRRYQTPAEASEDLARFQKGQTVLAPPVVAAWAGTTAVHDPDATVRTNPVIERRGPQSPVDERTARVVRVGSPQRLPFKKYGLLGCLGIVGVLAINSVIYAATEIRFWNDAEHFKAELQAEKITDLNDAWNQYQTLNKRQHWSVLLWGASSALRKRLVASADEVISEYRNSDAPVVFEPQWIQARADLARALELDPGNSGIEGRLRLTQAHIDRIEASSLKATARQKRLNAAVTKFEEAESLLGHSPDPELGLATLYVYDLNDVDKAEEALRKAAHNGHRMGSRETAQLGDGYRRRADRTWKQSRGTTAMPDEERSYLNRAKEDYVRAEKLYARAGLFGDSARNKVQAIRGEQRVEQRLIELADHGVWQ